MEPETNRDKALRGEVVRVSDGRLVEMQIQAIGCEGITANPVYHWHWAAVLNELVALRKIAAMAARERGIDLGYSAATPDAAAANLTKYGRHLPGCWANDWPVKQCNCGWDTVQKNLEVQS